MPSTRDPRLVIEQQRQLIEAGRSMSGSPSARSAPSWRSGRARCATIASGIGESPLQLVLRIRLDRVRHALLTGEGSHQHRRCAGFTALGHFSSLYRRAFGESPRDTLRGAGPLRPIPGP